MIEINPDLLAFLKEEEVRSRNEDLLERAEVSLASYNGELYGDEVDGRSKVVTRDVAEVIDWMTPSVIRVFVSGDRVVEFEPDGQEQEQFADDATEAIQRQFAAKGYQILHDWFKEGNISALGIVKSCVEMRKERVEQVVPTMLLDSGEMPEGIEIVGQDEAFVEDGIEKVKVAALVEQPPEFKDILVPLEEFRISPDARDPEEAAYIAHATVKTLSELTEMGFALEDLDSIQSNEFIQSLSYHRDNGLDSYVERKGALRRVILMEEYVRFDTDGDGIAERLCVHRVGDTVLRIEPCDYQPFVLYCPFPMPGRVVGHSLAEKVNDIQRINSALNRLALDGLYCNLAPGYLVNEGSVTENTYDDILNVRPNRIIRYKGAIPPAPEAKNDVSAVAWQAIEFMIGQRESRTGITRMNQGLDADALNKTARGTAMMQAAGQQMEEYLARNFGEAVARLMRLKLMLMSRYGGPMQLRVDGEYRQIDPREWPESMGISIRVGLGSGRKEERLMQRMNLLQIQRECMMNGLPIVQPEHIYKSIQGVVRDAGLGSPNDFVADPAQMPKQESKPSPEEQKVQAELQIKAAELQAKQQESAADLEMKREEAGLKAQLARDEAAAKLELERQKAAAEMDLAQQKMALEVQLAERKMAMQERLAERDAARRDYESDEKLKANRPGGKLDE